MDERFIGWSSVLFVKCRGCKKVFQRICICLINILGNTKMLFRTSNSWKREKMCCLDCFLSILCVYIYVVIIAFKFSKLKVQKN